MAITSQSTSAITTGISSGSTKAIITVATASTSSAMLTSGLPNPPVVAVEAARVPLWAALKEGRRGADDHRGNRGDGRVDMAEDRPGRDDGGDRPGDEADGVQAVIHDRDLVADELDGGRDTQGRDGRHRAQPLHLFVQLDPEQL